MGELSMDNILGEQEIDTLFGEPENLSEENQENSEEVETSNNAEENNETENTTEEEGVEEDLFGDNLQPESVGSGKDSNKGNKEDTVSNEETGTSPQNFYSSIANAFAVDGILPNLDDETIKKADSAEALSDLIEAEAVARLTDKQQRVIKALDNGVDASDIRKYENTLDYIASITDAALSEEGDKGEQLRRNLIYQDYLNKGYSPERAKKFTERSIDAGTDVEDAKDALQSNKEYFQEKYNDLLEEAQEAADREKAERKKQAEKLKTSILKDETLFGMSLSNEVRRKIFDNISKPVYKDQETGEYLTALQKYQMENGSDFLKYIGIVYTLTNGFKDFESFTKDKIKKEVRKGLRELEQTINNTKRTSDGRLNMVTNVREDRESFLNSDFKLAL